MESPQSSPPFQDSSTPLELKSLAQKLKQNSLPKHSQKVYQKRYDDFILWLKEKNTSLISENTILAYFQALSSQYAPTTLWNVYSCLRLMLLLQKNIDLKSYPLLTDYLWKNKSDHQKKKATIFTKDQIYQFLIEILTKEYLMKKLILLIAINGALRRSELRALQFEDISLVENELIINIQQSKTDKQRNGFQYFIVPHTNKALCCLEYYKKYLEMILTDEQKGDFFRWIIEDKKTKKQKVSK